MKIAILLFLSWVVLSVLYFLTKSGPGWLFEIRFPALLLGFLFGWHLVYRHATILGSVWWQIIALILLFFLSRIGKWLFLCVDTAGTRYFGSFYPEALRISDIFSIWGLTGFSYVLWRMLMHRRIRKTAAAIFIFTFPIIMYSIVLYLPKPHSGIVFLQPVEHYPYFWNVVFQYEFCIEATFVIALLYVVYACRSVIKFILVWKDGH